MGMCIACVLEAVERWLSFGVGWSVTRSGLVGCFRGCLLDWMWQLRVAQGSFQVSFGLAEILMGGRSWADAQAVGWSGVDFGSVWVICTGCAARCCSG